MQLGVIHAALHIYAAFVRASPLFMKPAYGYGVTLHVSVL